MQIFHYSINTKEFVGVSRGARLPAHSTDIAPPSNYDPKTQIPVFDEQNNKWNIVSDNRGSWYDKTDSTNIEIIENLNEAISNIYTKIPPPDVHNKYEFDGEKWIVPIDVLIDSKFNEAYIEYRRRLDEDFEYNEWMFSCDATARSNIRDGANAIANGKDGMTWIDVTGVVRNFTSEQFSEFVVLIFKRGQSLYYKLQQMKSELISLKDNNDRDGINDYDVTLNSKWE